MKYRSGLKDLDIPLGPPIRGRCERELRDAVGISSGFAKDTVAVASIQQLLVERHLRRELIGLVLRSSASGLGVVSVSTIELAHLLH